jgi:hypothetical protein
MARGTIGPGDDVEAWCTRCRMNLNHRIIAIVGDNIQRVQCLTCNGDHKYYPPKGQKTETGKRIVRVASSEKLRKPAPTRPTPEKALSEWNSFMRDLPNDGVPRRYNIFETYSAGEYIEHPTFGMGRVLEIMGAERIQVVFKDGRKVLVFNRKKIAEG